MRTAYQSQTLAPLADAHAPRFQAYTERQLDRIEPLRRLPAETQFAMRVVASVLPFRVNRYVIDALIDWDAAPDDPIFRLTFPHREMLPAADFERMAALLHAGAEPARIREAANEIRLRLNPHPGGQLETNIPLLDGEPLNGMQHKYRESVLFFPTQGQTCHSYCTFCFRWAQFVGIRDLRFSSMGALKLQGYLAAHSEVSDLLVTGGDPLVMSAAQLSAYLAPLLAPRFDHIRNISIGTKAVSYWPYRFISDGDSSALLRLFERIARSGKQLALMAHLNHWRELEPPAVREAVRRIRDTGAIVRTQSPMVAHINDDADVWERLWKTQTALGMVPYYLFVERDTGAKSYFALPLARAAEVYREAISRVSGLARTARGPCMSAGPGKVEIQGTAEIAGEQVFVLRFIQARNPDWVQRPFFARFDPAATWLNELTPAFGESRFFFER
ncbi:MAG TPA: lysine 2,3-aminomutase [Betaproteobacteria bacterium]|nr:lysine 2,3-aminomutase [Betaproteobacteria bacterium]